MAEDKQPTRLVKGLFQDSSPQDQPKNSYRFGLNGIMETDQGDNNFGSNEESNEAVTELPNGYTPVGKVYAGKNRIIIFSVSKDDLTSEIGIFHTDSNEYITHVNDDLSTEEDKLGFSIKHQIQATYRLRKGCEDTVYWTDDNKRPKYYNFNKAEAFKNKDRTWNNGKFNLQKTYSKIPNFQQIEVLESGGNLEPGSYNVCPQYLDESLNPTEWITSSKVVKIYNDLSNKEYRKINGSINSDVDYVSFPKTTKAIKVTLNNLDEDFPFYRLAFVAANNGSGNINEVIYSEVIPTSKNFFIYTGSNGVSTGTVEEIAMFNSIIEKAKTIEQIDNMLVLGNTQGKQTNYCNLQKYASRIKADCFTKKVILTDIKDTANPKNSIQDLVAVGYMPGEIYSFGIVYIYKDNTISPAYHIPGKSSRIPESTIFTGIVFDGQGSQLTQPMNNTNNKCSTVYTGNVGCEDNNYWGLDSEGYPLEDDFVRHHRFPLRTDINKPLVTTILGDNQTIQYYQLVLRVQGTLKVPVPCTVEEPDCGTDINNKFDIRVSYKVDGVDYFFTQTISPQNFANGVNNTYEIDLYQNSQFHSSSNFTDIVIEETNINGNYEPAYSQAATYFDGTPEYSTTSQLYESDVQSKICTTEVFGIKFSGIDLPSIEETGGQEIIGYYIVRNERTEFDKTILDTGVITPCATNDKYISHGLLNPQTDRISKKLFSIIHPEHKFLDKEYVQYDKIIHQGSFNVTDTKLGKINFDDVYDGSSYDKGNQKDGNDDGQSSDGSTTSKGLDGWSFNLISRDNITDFQIGSNYTIESEDVKDIFYLNALESKSVNDNANDVYNIACDNKIGIIELEQDNNDINLDNKMSYVSLYKHNSDSYSNFRILPYYKENLNPVYFNGTTSETTVFNGDSYVSPMRYVNTIYWDNKVAKRAGRTKAWKIVVGAFIAVLGAVLAVVTFGVSAAVSTIIVGAGIALIGGGALLVSSGIKTANFNKAYNEEYDKGLRQTVLDSWTDMFYNFKPGNPFGYTEQTQHAGRQLNGPSDDTIEWIADCATDLWFESSLNMSLRNHFVDDVSPTYLDAPGRIESGNNSPIALWEFFGIYYANSNQTRYPVSSLERYITRKLLAFDQTRDDNKYYIGVALGEYYQINPDYQRKNKEKVFYHLALEYDCCSDCQEDFPHRWHWSVQSYQEELSDNFRIFFPNNYRDLEGETGEITNMFKIGPELFIHTEEGLWQTIRNQQERITDQIVSFIGTGEYFSIPPRKVTDDSNGNTAGSRHLWGFIKTPTGVFFPSENQNKFYNFDGKKLVPISNTGISSWFKENTQILTDKNYLKMRRKDYPYRDNPSNPFGTGFISTYDSRKERVIFTKKDFLFKDSQINSQNYELCTLNGKLIIFRNIDILIETEEVAGWRYTGIDGIRMKFERETTKTRIENRWIDGVPNSTTVTYMQIEYKYLDGEIIDNPETINNSWTLSYSLKNQAWLFWHSYLPNFYMNIPEKFYSWINGNNSIWKHNKLGHYQTYYGTRYPFIIEYVSMSDPINTKTFEYIKLLTEAKKLNTEFGEFVEERFITFNKALFYNARQCSGVLNLLVKDINTHGEDYLLQQVQNLPGDSIIIDRNEKDWTLNQLRDIRVDYTKPIFKSNIESLQDSYFIDKVVNEDTIDFDKDWSELESFRDKYLVVRFIFDNFDDVKLLLNYSVENEIQSTR